ncbi:redox-sensing transcriptional repressor [Halanaerobium saccharolyticum]|uniref:redox-sensing transcriptional repressor Rex n=1 Tax=Halanaerobium saccharolyticum TaxID=43595 RepID=UPI001063C904|nr:redox-sensing transcriptional repressor Rex [Halanaerobium saccharolyticum]TDX51337.1 redox-sensing transcriptional repressor [Halanaerobium saccharolyticum]
MKDRENIPKATIERLPLYYRCLDKMDTFEDVEVVSSKDLGGRLDIPSTQVRKDLSYYGEFGRRGVGYNVNELKKSVGKILGVDRIWPAVLVGASNLGRALVNYGSFAMMGFEISHVLDNDLDKIGNVINERQVQSVQEIEKIVKENDIKLGVISVPTEAAQEVAEQMVEAGIKAIWNFAPTRLYVPDEIEVKNEDLAVGIVSLIYHLSWQEEMETKGE